jgi:hypothetical protein
MTSPHEQALAAAVREHDREEAAMRGEPDPWGDGQPEPAGDEWKDRIACMELAISAYLASLPAEVDGQAIDFQRIDDAIVSAAALLKALCCDDVAKVAGQELKYSLSAFRSLPAKLAAGIAKSERARAEALTERLAEMEAALEPFALLAGEVDALRHEDESTCLHRIRASDLRRARHARKETPNAQ